MGEVWYQCHEDGCVFGSNSRKQARIHIETTGHDIHVEIEEEK